MEAHGLIGLSRAQKKELDDNWQKYIDTCKDRFSTFQEVSSVFFDYARVHSRISDHPRVTPIFSVVIER